MRRFLLSLLVSGVIMGTVAPVLAQNVPFDSGGKVGKTGWTSWKREILSKNMPLLRYCSREYYKNGRYVTSQNKIIRIYQFC
ncbi:Uncharacterised protein [Yersinia aleksiciae]|uniref:Uncharacterized protein n=1 Tax=Yersinia aleksiciae TaxID=263819 RepID=A0A0T9UVW3_YERAE|nr:Uncharacterised protein [Yersinia aleksiciae]